MDKVFIQGLRVDTVVGVYDWEGQVRQTLVFDLELRQPLARAGSSDALPDTIDYAAVAQYVTARVGGQRWLLLERLAEDICAELLREFSPAGVRLRVTKQGAVVNAAAVGIEIVRGEWP